MHLKLGFYILNIRKDVWTSALTWSDSPVPMTPRPPCAQVPVDMLLCKADGIPLVNVVRRPEQVELLESIGAELVVDSSADSYESDLVKAMAGSGATICFDALGGGTLGFEIIRAMETAANMSGSERTGYGSTTFKKLYICECTRSLRVFFRSLKEAAAQTAD